MKEEGEGWTTTQDGTWTHQEAPKGTMKLPGGQKQLWR